MTAEKNMLELSKINHQQFQLAGLVVLPEINDDEFANSNLIKKWKILFSFQNMRTLLLLLAIVVFASARVPSKMFRSKGAKLCTFCNSFVGGIELGIASEEKDLEAVSFDIVLLSYTSTVSIFVCTNCCR